MTGVTGVVLAAGLSTRMGRPKAEVPFGGATFLDRAVGMFEGLDVDEMIVVVGPGSPGPASPGARVVVNERPAEGSVTSLLAAAAAAPGEWLVYIPVDMPELSPAVIGAAVAVTRRIRPWALVTEYAGGEVAHPFGVSPDILEAVAGRTGDKAMWPLFSGSAERVARVAYPGAARPADINTPEDLERMSGADGR